MWLAEGMREGNSRHPPAWRPHCGVYVSQLEAAPTSMEKHQDHIAMTCLLSLHTYNVAILKL